MSLTHIYIYKNIICYILLTDLSLPNVLLSAVVCREEGKLSIAGFGTRKKFIAVTINYPRHYIMIRNTFSFRRRLIEGCSCVMKTLSV